MTFAETAVWSDAPSAARETLATTPPESQRQHWRDSQLAIKTLVIAPWKARKSAVPCTSEPLFWERPKVRASDRGRLRETVIHEQ